MEATFREYGLPTRILSDNGPPFASTGLAGLSRLSVWWIRLGIQLQRIDPGHPEQNGRHERMHRTLKAETATPPERNLRAQQRAFDRFRQIYNQERPHESLAMATPASVYQPSWRPYPERLPELEYPDRMLPRRVQSKGDIGLLGRQLFLSETLAGETVGLEEHEHGWAVWFGPLELDWLERSLFEGPRPGRGEHRLRRKRSGGASSARPTGSLPRRPPSVSGKGLSCKEPSLGSTLKCVTHVIGELCYLGAGLFRLFGQAPPAVTNLSRTPSGLYEQSGPDGGGLSQHFDSRFPKYFQQLRPNPPTAGSP